MYDSIYSTKSVLSSRTQMSPTIIQTTYWNDSTSKAIEKLIDKWVILSNVSPKWNLVQMIYYTQNNFPGMVNPASFSSFSIIFIEALGNSGIL